MTDPQEQANRRDSNTAVYNRIYAVESSVAGIREQIAGITVNLNSQAGLLARIATSVESRSATDWKALAGWAGVLLTIVGLFTTLTLQPMRTQIQNQQDNIEHLNQIRIAEIPAQIQEAELRGRYRERIDNMEREFNRLREHIDPKTR